MPAGVKRPRSGRNETPSKPNVLPRQFRRGRVALMPNGEKRQMRRTRSEANRDIDSTTAGKISSFLLGPASRSRPPVVRQLGELAGFAAMIPAVFSSLAPPRESYTSRNNAGAMSSKGGRFAHGQRSGPADPMITSKTKIQSAPGATKSGAAKSRSSGRGRSAAAAKSGGGGGAFYYRNQGGKRVKVKNGNRNRR